MWLRRVWASLSSFHVNPGAMDSLGLTRRPQETARPRPRPCPSAGEDGRPRPRTAKRARTAHGQEGGPEGNTHGEEEQHHRSTTQEEHTRRAHHKTQLKSTGEEHNKFKNTEYRKQKQRTKHRPKSTEHKKFKIHKTKTEQAITDCRITHYGNFSTQNLRVLE